MKTDIAIIFGTRPEAIKLAPLILAFQAEPDLCAQVYVTGQHRQMLDQVLSVFHIVPDHDFHLMRTDQALPDLTARSIQAISRKLAETKPRLVIVQGDTTTTLAAAIAAYYNKIAVGHVEAGLRTQNPYAPFPEEMNRRLTSHLCELHFAPTEQARQNLLREGIPDQRIHVTGNTVVDALRLALEKVDPGRLSLQSLVPNFSEYAATRRIVLITGHRRESFGVGFEKICTAIARLAREFPDHGFIYPVHLNPNVQAPVRKILGQDDLPNVFLLPPLPYLEFIALLNLARIILTDSGGIQEEAASLGKPILVMRDATERPEAIEAGFAMLVGTEIDSIVAAFKSSVDNNEGVVQRPIGVSPFGDGFAADRIVAICRDCLHERPISH